MKKRPRERQETQSVRGDACDVPPRHCTWCHAPLEPIEVHGHVQCARCGINIDPCCGGAPSG